MLVKKEFINKIVCSPVTGELLKNDGAYMTVKGDHKSKEKYDIVDGCPILVNFEASILSNEYGNSEKFSDILTESSKNENYRIYNNLSDYLKRLVSIPPKITENNIKGIIDQLDNGVDNISVLIIGGGTVGDGMELLYESKRVNLVSFDIYISPLVQFIGDAHSIPLQSEKFDLVIIQAVLEHVVEPNTVVSEIFRVLKKNGVVYAETPFFQHVHAGAYDFTRYTESGHRYLFKHFSLIDSGVVSGAGTQLLWSIDKFFNGLFRSRIIAKMIKLSFFWLQYFDRLIPESYNIDSASAVFFIGRKSKKIEVGHKEIVNYYKGAQQ